MLIALVAVLLIPKEMEVWKSSTKDGQGHVFAATKGDTICSGHGVQFGSGTQTWCECFDCWSGKVCETEKSPCMAITAGGTPLMFEDYWFNHPDESRTTVDAAFKIGYFDSNDAGRKARLDNPEALIDVLYKLHDMVGNIDTKDAHLVFGVGSTQLISAAMYALAKTSQKGGKSQIWAKTPYYGAYPLAANMYESTRFEWNITAKPNTTERNVIEFVTSPNNPDGVLRKNVVQGADVVWDLAYRWPHYTPLSLANKQKFGPREIGLFTLSKLTGHAGTRFGWAWVGDKAVADEMNKFIGASILGVSRDTEYRAYVLLKHIVESQGEIMRFATEQMQYKWRRLWSIFKGSASFVFQPGIEPAELCQFANKVVTPAPAYAWVQCEEFDPNSCDSDAEAMAGYRGLKYCGCAKVFKDAGVVGVPGMFYGADPSWFRMEMMQRREDFETLAANLERLVKK